MHDPNDQLQTLPVVPEDTKREEFRIPSEAEHKRLIRRIFLACIVAGVAVFLVSGGIVTALFVKGYDSKKVVEVSTAVFQVLSMTAGVAFFIPLGLTSIVTLLLGIRMNRKSVGVLDKLDGAIESRLERVDRLVLKAEEAFHNAERGEVPASLRNMLDDAKKFVVTELGKLRDDIRGARASTEEELTRALDEGERELEAESDHKA